MFTGIIEETGRILEIRSAHRGARMTVRAGTVATGLKVGDSVAVSGVCLTVVHTGEGSFSCDLSSETLDRTSFKGAREGTVVNLERALEVGGRLGGHFVMGHVDGMGVFGGSNPSGDGGAVVTVEYPRNLARYIVHKGSVAVDGISLTIASLGESSFTVAVVPYTLENTNIGSLHRRDRVNLEVDILGRYIARIIELDGAEGKDSNWTLEYLKGQGY